MSKETKPLQVGDRVAFETNIHSISEGSMWDTGPYCTGYGTIIYVSVSGTLFIVESSKAQYKCTRRQLRRLVKKPRREWWIVSAPDGERSADGARKCWRCDKKETADKFYEGFNPPVLVREVKAP